MNKGQEIKQLKKEAAITEAISDQAIASCEYHTKLDMTSMACQFVSSEIKTSYMYEKHENIIKAKTPKPHQSPYAKNVQRAVSQKTAQKAQDRNLSAYSNALGQSDIQKAIANNFADFDKKLMSNQPGSESIFWKGIDSWDNVAYHTWDYTKAFLSSGGNTIYNDLESLGSHPYQSTWDAIKGGIKAGWDLDNAIFRKLGFGETQGSYQRNTMREQALEQELTAFEKANGVERSSMLGSMTGKVLEGAVLGEGIGIAGDGIAGAMSKMGFFGRTAGVGDEMLGVKGLPELKLGLQDIDPKEIRFSQPNVGPYFNNGSRVDELIPKLKTGKVSPYDIPPIQVVQKGGKLFSLDNRRLLAFNSAGVDKVPVKIVSSDDPFVSKKLLRRFDPIVGEGHYVVVVPKTERVEALNLLEKYDMIRGTSNGY